MDINRAKEVVNDYLEYNIDEDVKILGEDHPYEICDCTIGEVQEAYYMICEWFRKIEKSNQIENVMGTGSMNDQYEFNGVKKNE